MNIVVLGAGAWGSALASSLASQHHVTLWARDASLFSSMVSTHINCAYLPKITLNKKLLFSNDLNSLLDENNASLDLIIIATPLAALRSMCIQIEQLNQATAVLWLCKGIERDTTLLAHQIVAQTLGDARAYGVLSGPSFAQEVAENKPCALVMASKNERLGKDFADLLRHANLRIYHSTDVIGVEIGGAIKNILAIAAGICDGLELGLNARAALLTRGVAEMVRLGVAMGAQQATLYGLSGLGDLILTATGGLSRNRTVGFELVSGRSPDDITSSLGHVAEGVLCAHAMSLLASKSNVDMPIIKAVCAVLDGLSPEIAVQQLLLREPLQEVIE